MNKSLLFLAAATCGIMLTGCVDNEVYQGRAYGPRAAYYGGNYNDEPYYVNGGVQYYYSGGRYYYQRNSQRVFITELPSGGRYLHGNRYDDRVVDRRVNYSERNRVYSNRPQVQPQQEVRRTTHTQQVTQQEHQKVQKSQTQTVKKGDPRQDDHKKKGKLLKQDDQQSKRDQ